MGVQAGTQEEKFDLMTKTPVDRLICKLAVPTICSMLVTSVYNMADTYFVGQIGTSATGAVGVAFSMMAIIQALGFFFGQGSGSYISRRLGAKDLDDASRMVTTGVFSAAICGAIVGTLGLIFLKSLAWALGSTETILPYACEYLKYILIGTPWMVASLTLNNQLRFQGRALYSMIGIMTGGILNVGLDPLCIFVFHMGIGGAGFATMMSQAVSCALLVAGTFQRGNLRIHFRNFTPNAKYLKGIFQGGFPSLCRQSLASIATICLNFAAGAYGDAAIAAMSIVMRISNFTGSAVIGFGQGFQPVCGFNYGARKFDRVLKGFWFCVRIGTIIMLCLSVLAFIFSPQIVMLFRRDDPQVIEIGALALKAQCMAMPLLAWISLGNMMQQVIGQSVRATIMALARQGLFFLPLLAILVPHFGLFGIQICQPASDFCTALLAIPVCGKTIKELKLGTIIEPSKKAEKAG